MNMGKIRFLYGIPKCVLTQRKTQLYTGIKQICLYACTLGCRKILKAEIEFFIHLHYPIEKEINGGFYYEAE